MDRGYGVTGDISVPRVAPGVVVPIVDANKGPLNLDIRDVLSDGDYASPDDDSIFSIWLYQEADHVDRLQPGTTFIGEDPLLDSYDPCKKYLNPGYAAGPDQIVF
ncbi:MAG: hypothetical protein HY775_05465 [Acidobacteria bacterium]|nr:hypothetical protein [Acidobacteriota bacterium]